VQGELREPYPKIIDQLNEASTQTLAVDLPSGLDCDTGRLLGTAVRADLTASFVAPKVGFEEDDAQLYVGDVHVIDIGIPNLIVEQILAEAEQPS
jgi:NAD(P)H-hydrate epimerase